ARGMASCHARREADRVRLLAAGAGGDVAARAAALAHRLLEEEREKAVDAAKADQVKRIAQLERRIGKLRSSLSDSEALVRRLKEAKDLPEGVESMYREVQGLDPNESNAAEKRGLLEEIFKLNVELRDVIQGATAGPDESSGGPASAEAAGGSAR
ncbi:MAG: hypothetical protein ACF8XB_06665, partial [Planctomycetota bacterium JB042]